MNNQPPTLINFPEIFLTCPFLFNPSPGEDKPAYSFISGLAPPMPMTPLARFADAYYAGWRHKRINCVQSSMEEDAQIEQQRRDHHGGRPVLPIDRCDIHIMDAGRSASPAFTSALDGTTVEESNV